MSDTPVGSVTRLETKAGGYGPAHLLLRVLDHLEEWLIATLIATATALIFFAVVHRYGTGLSINGAKWAEAHGVPGVPVILRAIYTFFSEFDVSWAQELCIFMFIWMAKFGAAYGVRTGIHVGVDVIVNLLPPEKRKQVILFAIACGAFFTGVIAAFGTTFVAQMYETGQQSYDLEWPMWAIYLAIPVGSGLMCFRFLQVAWSYYWTGELPHHNEARVEGTETADPVLPSTSPHGTVPSRWANPLALGLTVLSFVFILTEVPIESVSMKLFTGLESFEIMAIPFFILAGNFLSHGGVARRMINFAVSLIGHWRGGLGLAGIIACAMFALVCGS